ncbi:hypothetical protein EHS13_32995 [Paenibacillus psychroresistens]|uniref:Uncharacterized protein n=1 Tax=Paenibacillus psychroresistens TaxID=1778678 RepID=A0A6B8RTY5_9BACL|nr:hypothetical protein [Paenibacillus psychroresistens]QGQ99339.1 hypothetical protein EHS13_32995 [Paenibacillus psychroresistens]
MIQKAKNLFEEYQTLSQEFNDKITNLYSDSAEIKFTVVQSGNQKIMSYSGKEFKELIIIAMPIAKDKNDLDIYSDINYAMEENNRVKITANRYSSLYKYNSPYTTIIGPNESGEWLIWEENFEMQR